MSTRHLPLTLACLALGLLCSSTLAASEAPVKVGAYTISGPYVQDNLSVFLIHGANRLPNAHYLTLAEALERKIVIVHETGDVNQLTIENVSPDQQVYIQSGDIVRGGRQDRTIAMDFIVPPHSGIMPIDAFCVEHGRWTQRGVEAAEYFSESDNQVAGKALKLAAKQEGSQSKVWMQVHENQEKLSAATSQPVADLRSATSFELSLDTAAVTGHIDQYVKKLQPVIDNQDDVIGYAFAINGKINSADIYANHALFAKLWPKLLKSSAVEALSEVQKGKTFAAARADAVKACIEDARKGKSSEKDVSPRVKIVTQESDGNVVFETRDRAAAADAPVHENYVNKK